MMRGPVRAPPDPCRDGPEAFTPIVRRASSSAPRMVGAASLTCVHSTDSGKRSATIGRAMIQDQATVVAVNRPGQVLFASLIGTTIEFFDFYIYATAAVLVFPRLFFPKSDPASATLASQIGRAH